MGIFVGIGNYIGRVRQIGPNDYYIITEDEIAVLTERGKHILLDIYVTEDEIAAWVKEHMVFWYDVSRPMNVYIPGITYANPFVNEGGVIKYDTLPTKCTITHTPSGNANIAFWQIKLLPLQTVESYKIRVTGLPKGSIIKGRLGYGSIQITTDGEYDVKSYTNTSSTNTTYPGFYLSGDNINGIDCNIVVEEIPTRQSVPTNEILKANPYLQDFSGNNRPLKLNNFLFAAMSGVGGYDIADTNILPDRANVTVTDNRIIHITKKLSTTDNMVNIVPANSNPTHKFKVTGLSDGRQVSLVNRNGGFYTFDNGEHEVTLTYPEGTTSLYNAIGVTGSVGDIDVTIEFIPRYPNALVTDGVDDYGQVQNLQQGVKMLFMTANPLGLYKAWYAQDSFSIYGQPGVTAYNFRNTGGVTYLDGGNNSIIFFNSYGSSYMNMAFYNSIGFDAVPEGNVTLQRVINYVINNILNKA